MFKIFLFVLIAMMTVNTFSQQPPLESGVSQTLAKWRAANYSDVRYKLDITLEKSAALMKGEIEISVKLTDEGAKNDLVLDWRTTQFQNDKDKPFADVTEVNKSVVKESAPNGVFDYQTNKEHLIVSKKYLKTGENKIKINFASPIKTSGAGITRYIDKEDGAEYVYSLFVPSDASTAFPVFDQPDLKARFQLNVKAPRDWNVVSNTDTPEFDIRVDSAGVPTGEIYLKEGKWVFFETKPISTYVFAFAAGDFEEFKERIPENIAQDFVENESSVHGIPNNSEELEKILLELIKETSRTESRIYVRKSQAEKFKAHSKEVFRLNREVVKYLEDYFDYKFPFPKYDLVLIPEFPFGGMEHAGATFLRESSVIFPTEPTKNDYYARANVIFHEAAHQWFGDTVTMKWFDDLWLKEGFANFMAAKAMEKIMPEMNVWKIFYEKTKQSAYATDSTKGTTPIYQEIPNLSAAKSAYGNIVYSKAPSFLKQAEFYLGEKEFQTAVRQFLKKHEFSNATWQNLVGEFETTSKQDLKDWAKTWVTEKGLPIVRSSLSTKKRGPTITYYDLSQKDVFGRPIVWKMRTKMIDRHLAMGKDYIDAVILDKKVYPDYLYYRNILPPSVFIFPNYQDYGYGIFLLDEQSRAYVLANIQTEKDDFLRAMMWGSLWDSVRETELAPEDYVRLVIKVLSSNFSWQNADGKPAKAGTQNFTETDESTIQTLLGRTSTAMNYYLSDKQREELLPQVENLLIDKIQNAATAGQRITFYRAFLNIASSEKARNVLLQILNGDLGIGGGNTKMRAGATNVGDKTVYAANPAIPLKTKDRFDIVTKLLILGDANAPQLLADLEKRETSDEAKRYAYAAKAGIATAENKQKFWQDFTENKELSESWIEAAFGSFNSIRHSELTLPYLEKALAELPNLKKNRKIFFVNGWLGAFIGGQKSEGALKIVNKFLEDNPNLDKDLRLKILENVDGLERAVKIRAQYEK